MFNTQQFYCLVIYFIFAFVAAVYRSHTVGRLLFSASSIAFTYLVFYNFSDVGSLLIFSLYLLFVFIMYYLIRKYGKDDRTYLLPYIFPILFLILDKGAHFGVFIGISYMSFRLSLSAIEVYNEDVELPSLIDYMGFAFFSPTMLMGPINTLKNHMEFLNSSYRFSYSEVYDGVYRVAVGIFKFYVAGPIFENVGIKAFIGDGFNHSIFEFIIATFCSFVFLYMNFSGFCDIIIGLCSLFNLKVRENFYFPFASRNISDFWNRWHISMSHYMRDTFFSPLSVFFSRKIQFISTHHIVAFTSFLTFFLIGIWHGTTLNYIILGVMHGLGALVYQYYSTALRRRGKTFIKWYNDQASIRYLMICLTISYVSFVSLLFIDKLSNLQKYFDTIN